jgi:hypothetical protein
MAISNTFKYSVKKKKETDTQGLKMEEGKCLQLFEVCLPSGLQTC